MYSKLIKIDKIYLKKYLALFNRKNKNKNL